MCNFQKHFFTDNIIQKVFSTITQAIKSIFNIIIGSLSVGDAISEIQNLIVDILRCFAPTKITELIPIIGPIISDVILYIAKFFEGIPFLSIIFSILTGQEPGNVTTF